MWLQVPDQIGDALWEGRLLADEASLAQSQRSWSPGRERVSQSDMVRDLPAVSIGRPESWPLAEVFAMKSLPTLIRASMENADFHLVRLACSFTPQRDSRIEWARFVARLLPDEAGRQPVTEDLHPSEVIQAVQHQTKLTIAPSLKFEVVEASVGSVELGIQYTELQPRISGSGQLTSSAIWNYFEVPGVKIQGGKWMHLLVKVPKGMLSAVADIRVAADVATSGAVVRALIGGRTASKEGHLTAPLWGGLG